MNEQDRQFVEAAKQVLDASIKELDGVTLARLARARTQALAGRGGPRPYHRRPLPLLGMTASALAAAAVVLFLALGSQPQEAADPSLVADLGVLASEESIEFFQEIEFYEWLSTVDEGDETLSDVRGAVPDAGGTESRPPAAPGHARRGTGYGDAGVSRLI